MNNFTIIICSYKAHKEFKLCLHQLARYDIKPYQVKIYENSPADFYENRDLLNKYNIEYENNPGGSHAVTINSALRSLDTKYALLLDSDCFCIKNPEIYIDYVSKHNIQLYGDICGNRSGWNIHKRVHPWYCIVDIDFLNNHNIWFMDEKRITNTNSWSFFDIKKLTGLERNNIDTYYDVGSTMFEDISKAGGVIADIGETHPYVHLEGCSWHKDSNINLYNKHIQFVSDYLNELYTICKFDERYLQLLNKSLY